MEDHNKYIFSLDKWKEIYNVRLDKYYLNYEDESGDQRISLNNSKKLAISITERIQNKPIILPIAVSLSKFRDSEIFI